MSPQSSAAGPAAKRREIVAASVDVFSRYGYRRTSMELIAEAAGVSRPALYQHFRNKKDVFAGVAALIGEQMGAAARAAADSRGTLSDRLYALLSIKLETAVGVPDARYRQELIAEANTLVGQGGAAAVEQPLADVLAATLGAAPELDLSAGTGTAADTAALLLDATTGIGQSDAPPDVLRQRLRQLVAITVRALRAGLPV